MKIIKLDLLLVATCLCIYWIAHAYSKEFGFILGTGVLSLYLMGLLIFPKINLLYKPTYSHWFIIVFCGVIIAGLTLIKNKNDQHIASLILGILLYHLSCISAYQKEVQLASYGKFNIKKAPSLFWLFFLIIAFCGVKILAQALVV